MLSSSLVVAKLMETGKVPIEDGDLVVPAASTFSPVLWAEFVMAGSCVLSANPLLRCSGSRWARPGRGHRRGLISGPGGSAGVNGMEQVRAWGWLVSGPVSPWTGGTRGGSPLIAPLIVDDRNRNR